MMQKYKKIVSVSGCVLLVILAVEMGVRLRSHQVEIYSVNRTVLQREEIRAEDVIRIKVPEAYVDDRVVIQEADLIGKYVALEHRLYANQPILAKSLESLDDAADKPVLLLRPRQVLYSMKADVLLMAGNALVQGQYVDVAFSDQQQSFKLLENVRIVGVRDRKGLDIGAEGGVPHVVLLAVDARFVDILLKADERGDFILLGKPYGTAAIDECVLIEGAASYFESGV